MATIEEQERPEAQLVPRDAAAADARALLRGTGDAVLCTISRHVAGWPFGSVVPYALDAAGRPILLISAIAQHTKNIVGDDRVSLFVQAGASGHDVQTHGRLTVMGRASKVDAESVADARARYLARFPAAVGNFQAHDFSFYRVSIENVRYIGGFGKIFWLGPESLSLDPAADPLCDGADGVIEHMNADHANALVMYAKAFKGLDVTGAKMVGVDQFGFDVECEEPQVRLRFDFDEPVTMDTIRQAMVGLVKAARNMT